MTSSALEKQCHSSVVSFSPGPLSLFQSAVTHKDEEKNGTIAEKVKRRENKSINR